MELFTTEEVQIVYEKIRKGLTEEQVHMCNNLLGKVIKNIAHTISGHVEIHKKIYQDNETYRKFVDNVFNKNEYNKLLSLGEAQKSLDWMNNMKSLGLFGLTKKVFGYGNKEVERKYQKYLDDVYLVLDSFNASSETGDNFVLYFLTVLTLKGVVLEILQENVEAADIQ